ncbi:MAG: YceI family protein [Candidatus Tectimicrobiota bacterium]
MQDRRAGLVLLSGVLGWLLWLGCLSSAAAERYVIVPQKSQIRFKAYSVLARPLGKFTAFAGEILADPQHTSASSVQLRIEVNSLDTENARRDKHLRSADFFFVERYPTITFVSTAITGAVPMFTVTGDLNIRGVTQRLSLPVQIEQRPGELQVQGQVALNRRDFGITYDAIFNPLQDMVDILFTIVGVRQ